MQTEHTTNLGALFLRAFAPSKSFQQDGSVRFWFGQFTPSRLDAELVEKLYEDFEVLVHSDC